MSDLYSQAVAFLNGPRIISEPGRSLTHLIARYVDGELRDNPEVREQLVLCLRTAQTAAVECKGDAQIFYQRAAAILQGIQTEVSAGRAKTRRTANRRRTGVE